MYSFVMWPGIFYNTQLHVAWNILKYSITRGLEYSKILNYTWPGIFYNTQLHVAWNILEQNHVFICDVAWNILGRNVLFKLALFILEMLKVITSIYAHTIFNTSSDVRSTKISRKKSCWPLVGVHRHASLPNQLL